MSEAVSRKPKHLKHTIISILGLSLIAGLIILLVKGLSFNMSQLPSALIGKPAKSFAVEWIQGREHLPSAADGIALENFKGKPVVVNFWASWCVSCRQEALDLERFWQTKSNHDVAVVGIAIQDTPEKARTFAARYGKTYILGLDNDGKAAIDYGVTGVPETFIINREGIIVHKEAGPVTAEMLQRLTRDL